MKFRMAHHIHQTSVEFADTNAPDWLTSVHSIPGSTMDYRWFWERHVLTLPVGGSIETDFHTIERVE